MKICLTANAAWNLTHFRLNHLTALQEMGVEVHAAAPPDGYEQQLIDAGIQFHPWLIERRSLNPMYEFVSVRRIQKIYNRIRPDLVHHYTVKAVLYGTTAARLAGVPSVVNSVTGLPYIIVSPKRGITKRFARWLAMQWYGWSVKGKRTHVILQNHDDLDMLESFAFGVRRNATITNGSGVDLKRYLHVPPARIQGSAKVNVVFVGRFLREKGVYELMDAVRILRQQKLPFRMMMCGDLDPGNRSSATADELQAWKQDGLIDWSGHVDDVREKLAMADVVVLPSYREGTPRSLLEAMAVGRPLVTTDVPGCRNVVRDEENGFIVPPRSSVELAAAIARLINDESMRVSMGQASRELAVRKFDERRVISQTLDVYRQLSGSMPPLDRWSEHDESLLEEESSIAQCAS